MLALERRNQILEKLQAEKRVVVSDLSQLYNVSEETIRRDLDISVLTSYSHSKESLQRITVFNFVNSSSTFSDF